MDKLWYLSRISIFDSLSPEDFKEIDMMAPITHFNAVPKGTLIQTPEHHRDGLFFVKTGKLRMYKVNAEGKQFTAAILGIGNMFGEIDSLSFGTHDMYIETIEETLICSVLREHFEKFLLKRPELAMRFLKVLSNQLKEKEELLEKLAIGNVEDRVLHLLLKLSEQFGTENDCFVKIDFPLTHQEIANMIGVTRESVTTILKDLSQKGILRTGRMQISVHSQKISAYLNHAEF
jgi:CRP/FNR family transcriptional regulator, anaerobic regulatory protein